MRLQTSRLKNKFFWQNSCSQSLNTFELFIVPVYLLLQYSVLLYVPSRRLCPHERRTSSLNLNSTLLFEKFSPNYEITPDTFKLKTQKLRTANISEKAKFFKFKYILCIFCWNSFGKLLNLLRSLHPLTSAGYSMIA